MNGDPLLLQEWWHLSQAAWAKAATRPPVVGRHVCSSPRPQGIREKHRTIAGPSSISSNSTSFTGHLMCRLPLMMQICKAKTSKPKEFITYVTTNTCCLSIYWITSC
jgi:hypothetical protein